MKQDIDRLLSYETKQQVRILDRWLGVSFVGFQLLILAYIVGYVFLIDDGYLEYEYARGLTTTYIDKTSDVAVQSSGKMVGLGKMVGFVPELGEDETSDVAVQSSGKTVVQNLRRGGAELGEDGGR